MNTHQPVDLVECAGGRPAEGTRANRPAMPVAGRVAGDLQSRRRWNSQQLLGDQHEIEIAHADSIYRLRITSLGKLILTK